MLIGISLRILKELEQIGAVGDNVLSPIVMKGGCELTAPVLRYVFNLTVGVLPLGNQRDRNSGLDIWWSTEFLSCFDYACGYMRT